MERRLRERDSGDEYARRFGVRETSMEGLIREEGKIWKRATETEEVNKKTIKDFNRNLG